MPRAIRALGGLAGSAGRQGSAARRQVVVVRNVLHSARQTNILRRRKGMKHLHIGDLRGALAGSGEKPAGCQREAPQRAVVEKERAVLRRLPAGIEEERVRRVVPVAIAPPDVLQRSCRL